MSYPATVHLTGIIGDTVYLKSGTGSYIYSIQDTDGLPLDLTGGTVSGTLVTDVGSPNISAVPVILDGIAGRFQIKFTAADTAGLTPDVYPYHVKVTMPDGEVFTLVRGNLKLESDIV